MKHLMKELGLSNKAVDRLKNQHVCGVTADFITLKSKLFTFRKEKRNKQYSMLCDMDANTIVIVDNEDVKHNTSSNAQRYSSYFGIVFIQHFVTKSMALKMAKELEFDKIATFRTLKGFCKVNKES
jgi:kynurenine formamidase